MALGLVVLVATAAPAVAAPREAPVEVGVSPAGLSWQPGMAYRAATLVVAGSDGVVLKRRHPAGEPISFVPLDAAGQPLADGWYRWELRLARALEPGLAEALAAAEAAGDGAAIERIARAAGGLLVRASGRFRVEGGGVQVPAEAAAESETARGAASQPAGQGPAPAAVTETDEVKITGTDPQLVLEDTEAGEDDFQLEAEADELVLSNLTTATDVLTVDAGASAETLYLRSGSVGFFTAAPDTGVELHVVAPDDVPELLLEDSGASAQAWWVQVLANSFQVQDATAPFPPTGGLFEIETSGGFSPIYAINLRADTTIEGDLSVSSSRTLKSGLEPVAGAELVAALAELPLYEWSYRGDPAGARHLGPVAEEFHALFGLGRDGRHISPADTARLALAVAQELAARLAERDGRIAVLEARLGALEAALAAAPAAGSPGAATVP